MIASDNTRDPFYPFGDMDMMEVWREGVRILHLDYPFADWAPTVAAAPAEAMGLDLGVLRPGGRADMILTRARDFPELHGPSAIGSHRCQKRRSLRRRAS